MENTVLNNDGETLMSHQSFNEAVEIDRLSVMDKNSDVLADIYREDTNIVVWQRQLDEQLIDAADWVLQNQPNFQASIVVSPENAKESLIDRLGDQQEGRLIAADIAHLVDMFCCLFELEQVGLRLTSLNKAMCPKFHVDRVPGRLVTTYRGVASEWLPHQAVNREKLGKGAQGKPDSESGLYSDSNQIKRLNEGDVALLKGELWAGNEGGGLVHRSPNVPANTRRLLLTLDFMNN